MNRKLFAFAVASIVALAASQASAGLVTSVDMSGYNYGAAVQDPNYTGTGAAPYAGPGNPTWNDLTSGSSSDLLDSTGGSTNIQFAGNGPGYGYAGYAPEAGGAFANLLSDFVNVGFGSPLTFTLSNVPAGAYALYIYAQHGAAENAVDTYSVTGAGSTVIDNTLINNSLGLQLGANYGVFGNIVVGSAGTLSFTDTTASLGGGNFNGFQLDFLHSVPEPSSFVLAGIGLVGAIVVVRRRKQK